MIKEKMVKMLVILLLFSVLFNVVPVNAWNHYGKRWNHLQITICPATDYDEFLDAYDNWNDCEIDPYFQTVPGTNADAGIYDVYKPSKEWAGYTTCIYWYYWILSANIQINSYWCDTYSSDQITNVMGHELGHCLGLAHETTGYPLMYPYVRSSPTAPIQDDIDGINDLYG